MKRILVIAALIFSVSSLALGQPPDKKGDQGKEGEKVVASTGAEEAIRKLDGELADAAARNDTATIERIYADDFTFTSPFGNVSTKAQLIAAIKSGELKYESLTQDDVNVRVYGDAAVVTGRANVKLQNRGEAINGQFRFTRTYVKKDGRWQLVVGQSTRIAEQPTK